LTTSAARHPKGSDIEPFPVGYKSTILEQFVESLARWNDVQILDAGPVCQDNIIYFARRVKKLYACDMFIRLHRALGGQPEPGNFCKHLDYPPFSFDGIQLWDLIDHLDDDQAKLLLERCYDMLRPAGLLMLITSEKKPEPATINTLIIGRNYRLDLRPQRHLELPWYGRHNRALMSLLAEFTSVRLFRYRNGLREFLFKRSGLIRD
jgi:hypothetical protein